ncbi:MAG: DUF1934 domain-containing protein [Clostridia bacterium]
MPKIPVLISISANAHRDDDNDEPMSLLTVGEMTLDGEKTTIHYEETLDESIPAQPVEIVAFQNTVSMMRAGSYETNMVFQKGQRYEGQYHTPVGTMELAIYCTRLRYEFDEEGGELLLSYQLDLNSQFTAVHDLELRLMVQHD